MADLKATRLVVSWDICSVGRTVTQTAAQWVKWKAGRLVNRKAVVKES